VATRTPEGRFQWAHPERLTWERYDGEMVWFHGRATDLLVTPALQMPWMPDARNHPRIATAAEIRCQSAKRTRARAAGCTLATSAWDAPEIEDVTFPGVRHSKMGPKPRDVCMTGDQFAAFMGMYIAEGNATYGNGSGSRGGGGSWLVEISQTPDGKGYDEYREVIADIFGREPGKCNYGNTWVMHSRAMYDYLRPLGKAKVKWIPRDVLDLSRRQLEIFWRYYFLGDGSYATGGQEVVATASKRMAGELQEIVQKLGWSAAVRWEITRPNALVKTANLVYKLGIRKTLCPAFSMDSVPYAGMVGHAAVPDGIVYVRRDGKPAWCG
jgi:replicative DNA helicase Mcm